ncbi:MAG TPA: hypothetical protein PK264_13170 [Hyphomicrobiaceae bacterium]|nr:hypothetical protein [Hyphomicrobiaceae bacterium]
MLDQIEHAASVSIARACGFAMLGIATFLIGLSAVETTLMLKTGGILTLIVCLALVLKASLAAGQPYKSTEVWIMLPPEHRPGAAIAQQVIGTVLRETYLRFAIYASLLSAALFAAALVSGLAQ